MGRNKSALWKSLQECKGEMAQQVRWVIGDGTRVQVSGQPWYDGWDNTGRQRQGQLNLKVADLFDNQTGQWKSQMQ